MQEIDIKRAYDKKDLDDKIAKVHAWIEESSNIVFFGGAGVSTESGIPDFRSVDGLYNQKYAYPPETILSHDFFFENTRIFFEFYKEKILLDAKPNVTHIALANLEKKGKLKAIITQNIDGLHQVAGSKTVYELHGAVQRNFCTECNAFHGIEHMKDCIGKPYCTECGALVKPDVVLYGEGLDSLTCDLAINCIRDADMLIIGGTSLNVYPAAGLIDEYRGKKLLLINKEKTQRDNIANFVVHTSLGNVFEKLA